MIYNELLEGRDASLWHGIQMKYAHEILSNMKIEGRTTQRYWPDGMRRREDDPDYEDSFWMKGISTTRDPLYASSWGSLVLELDQAAITRNYKIVPYSWGFHMKGASTKREREEFIILSMTGKSMKDYEKISNDSMQTDNPTSAMNLWYAPEGKALDLNKCLKGVYISDSTFEIYGEDNDEIQYIMKHPKFKGLLPSTIRSDNPEKKAARKELRDRINSQIKN